MTNDAETLPPEIMTEAGELIAELRSAGWTVQGSEFGAKVFGNWFVDLQHAGRTMRLVKDRSQFMVDGPSMQQKKDAGLWRAFDSFEEFREAIKKFSLVK